MNESEIISSFIKKEDRERVRFLLESERGRKKFLSSLSHKFIDKVEPKFIKRITGTKAEVIKIVLDYFSKKEINIISEDYKLDKTDIEINEALENIVGYGMGTIIYSIDGNLMYYEGEDQNENYLIIKNSI